MRGTYEVTTPHKSHIIRCLTDCDYRLSKPELTLSSFCIFQHIFSLGNVTSTVYIVCGGCTLTFGTKSESSRVRSDVCVTPTGTESKSAARGYIGTPLKRSVVNGQFQEYLIRYSQ